MIFYVLPVGGILGKKLFVAAPFTSLIQSSVYNFKDKVFVQPATFTITPLVVIHKPSRTQTGQANNTRRHPPL